MAQAGLSAELDRCWPWLAAALETAGSTHTKDQVLAAIVAGEVFLWSGPTFAAALEFYVTPRTKAASFWLVGGELKAFLAAVPSIEAWARAQGCTHCIGMGRAAWGRAIRRLGYQPVHVTFEKEL